MSVCHEFLSCNRCKINHKYDKIDKKKLARQLARQADRGLSCGKSKSKNLSHKIHIYMFYLCFFYTVIYDINCLRNEAYCLAAPMSFNDIHHYIYAKIIFKYPNTAICIKKTAFVPVPIKKTKTK